MKATAVFLLVLSLGVMAFAQDAPKAEVFGGYQFLSLDGQGGPRESLNGFNADLAFHAAPHVAIVGDFGLGFKTVSVDTGAGIVEAKLKMYPILFGPRFVANTGKISPFAEGLIGITHLAGSASFGGVSGGGSVNKFSYAFGGGLDAQVNPNIAVRLAKVDYLLVRLGEGAGTMKNFRLSTGIVFKF